MICFLHTGRFRAMVKSWEKSRHSQASWTVTQSSPSCAAPACSTAGRQQAAKSAWVLLMDRRTHPSSPGIALKQKQQLGELKAGHNSGKPSTCWQRTAGGNAQRISIHPFSASLPGCDILPKTAALSSAIIGYMPPLMNENMISENILTSEMKIDFIPDELIAVLICKTKSMIRW